MISANTSDLQNSQLKNFPYSNFVLNLFGLGDPTISQGLLNAVATTLVNGASLYTIFSFAQTFGGHAGDSISTFAPYVANFLIYMG
jgi:hypothetical protein